MTGLALRLYYGKGAGSEPTGSAVVSDIVDMALRMEVKKPSHTGIPVYRVGKRIKSAKESLVPYYMRFTAEDRPGVLSKVSGILGGLQDKHICGKPEGTKRGRVCAHRHAYP